MDDSTNYTQPTQQPQAPQTNYGQSNQGGPSGGKSNKGLIIGIVAGVVGLIIVIGVVLAIILSSFGVSKNDYMSAYNKYTEVQRANSELASSLSSVQYASSSTTDTEFKNDTEAANEALTTLRTKNEELTDMKAVKSGEGKEKFEAYNAKFDQFTAYVDQTLVSASSLRPAIKACDASQFSSSSEPDEYKAELKKCTDAINALTEEDVPEELTWTYVQSLQSGYTDISATFNKIAKLSDPFGDDYDQYRDLSDQLSDSQDVIYSALRDYRSNTEKKSKEVSPREQANALGSYLSDQAI